MRYPLFERKFRILGVAVIIAGLLGWLAISGAGWLAPLTLAGVALFVLVPSASIQAIVPFAFGMVLIIASATDFVPAGGTAISVGLRFIGIAFLALSSFQKSSSTARFDAEKRFNSSQMRLLLPWVITSYLLYLILSTAFHGQWLNFILYGAGVVLLAITLIATTIAAPYKFMAKAVVAALVFVLAASVVYGLGVPSVGIAGARLRGITSNANTLGFYAFLLGSLALIVVQQTTARVVLIVLSIVVVFWTSSRASVLALAFVFVFVFMSALLSRRSLALIVAVLGVIVAAVLAVIAWPRALDLLGGLLRNNDSRVLTFDTAVEAFRSSPLFGIGMGNNSNEIASSPLRALAFAGIGGLIAVIVLWISFLWFSRRGGVQTIGFSIAAIIHSFFEGWMLSPISPLLLVFVVCWWVIVRSQFKPPHLALPSIKNDVATPKGSRRIHEILARGPHARR